MHKVLIFILFLSLLFSCKPSRDETTEDSDTTLTEPEVVYEFTQDSLKSRITMLTDSMNVSWERLIETDNQKFADIKRLLQEVTYTRSYDPRKVESLMKLVDSVKAMQYTQDGMTSSQIDSYDIATENLIKKTFELVEKTPEMEGHSITAPLRNDIMKAESDLVNNRIIYDRWAKEYNALVDRERQKLQQLGEPYSSYQKKPIFELPS